MNIPQSYKKVKWQIPTHVAFSKDVFSDRPDDCGRKIFKKDEVYYFKDIDQEEFSVRDETSTLVYINKTWKFINIVIFLFFEEKEKINIR